VGTLARLVVSVQLHLFVVLSGMVHAGDCYLAPDGNDANPGTRDRPFATLQRAQQEARKRNQAGFTVYLRGGDYYLPETLAFTAADSGMRETPVVYQAYASEKPVISGGVRLPALQWKPYKDGILQAKVPAGFTTDQLFVSGQRRPLARYPNYNPNERIFNGYAADAFSPARAARWKDPAGGFIHALHAAEWGGMHYVITSKQADNKITFEGGWQNNRPMGMHSQFRFVENIFEELDAPGEWFLDTKTSTLYFFPPAGLDLARATIEGVRLKQLVEFRGSQKAPVRFVTLKGLTFRHAARTFMENKEPLVRSDWTTYRGGAVFYNGTEDCSLEDCFLDQLGGNAVFVNNYNRRVTVRGCHIAEAGANGVAFVGDRDSARVPRDWNDHSQTLATLDRTPGPKSANYPADCLVDDCLIYRTGRVEKQTSPVQIELAQGITVRHCSIYDVPRAGINIGDGCWGGHVIEYCDIFDTVKETGDHGSFNSWGRDRYWSLPGLDLNDDRAWEANKKLVLLDAVKTTILRNSRWRCDHGWDIDLDDGSSNYEIRNNLCLHGGLKNREGFYRVVENNVIVNNSFHPHVWYKHSQDIFRRNIVFTDYAPIGVPKPWGKEVDYNLLQCDGASAATPAISLQRQSGRDEHSIIQDARFVDPAHGDYRVQEGSPALRLGFVNFPMDQFGVQRPELKAIARTPLLPQPSASSQRPTAGGRKPASQPRRYFLQAEVRDIRGLGERSAYGLPDESGVLLLDVPTGTVAATVGLQKDDVIVAGNGKPVRTAKDLDRVLDKSIGQKLNISVVRKQKTEAVTMLDVPQVTETPQQRAARMRWWRDAKFGMFLHWGPVSLSGKELSWGRNAHRPWDINGVQTPRTEDPVYDNLYKQFNPVKFNAEQWVQIARDAGMKYMVIICKHHDGFSMFDSKLTQYDIMATPYGKDIIKQFSEACHKAGMRLGLYYSTRDWYHPDYLVGDNAKYDKWYRGQVEELLSNYGNVDVMWFDHVGGQDWGKWDFEQLFSMMYRFQPRLIVNNRSARFCGPGLPSDRGPSTPFIKRMTDGDFGTPEQSVGHMDLQHDWESCMTLVGGQWSYQPSGRMYTLDETLGILISCVTGGGNLLLNIGPTPTGEIEPRQVELLKQVGDWIKPRATAIYNTRGGPYANGQWGGSTHRGNTVFVFARDWKGGTLHLPPLPQKIKAVRKVADGKAVTFQQTEKEVEFTLPKVDRDPNFTVFALTLDAPVSDALRP
jgi:alpha-L-fucosidase